MFSEKAMHIYVNKLFPSETIELKVRPKDTIKDVKHKIQSKQGIPADQQTIVFAGSRYRNEAKLKDCNISDSSILHLVLAFCKKIEIYVMILSGDVFCLNVLDNDTVNRLKRKIEGITKRIFKRSPATWHVTHHTPRVSGRIVTLCSKVCQRQQ